MNYKIRLEPEKRVTNFKKIMKQKGLSQKQVSILANMEEYQISKIANGEQNDMLLSTAKRICNSLGTNLHETFCD